jgi:N-acetylmuramoyl-L-alanine amidase
VLRRTTIAALALIAASASATGCTASAGGSPPVALSTPGGIPTPSPSGRPGTARPSTGRPAPTARPTTTRPRPTPTPTRPPAGPPRGTVVVIDPGHNGGNAAHPEVIDALVPAGFGQYKPCNTTGTASNAGYPEHAFNWDVAQRVRTVLAARGVSVLFTRGNDTGVGPCVDDRAGFGNAHHAAAVVAIHGDGHIGGHGYHVIEAARAPAGSAMAAASHRLAVAVHDRYGAESGFTPATYVGSGGYDHRTDLAGLNLSTRPTILIECGNMRDSADAARMGTAAGRQRLAQAIADGILRYLAG